MTTLADKISFAETYITNKEGRQFSLKGRDWVRDEFFLPADGFKLWRPEGAEICDRCVDHVAEIIEHPDDNPTRAKGYRHKKKGCPGLNAEPIIVTILNLHRQDGKTSSCTAYALTALLKSRNKSIGFLAASEDQAKALFRENYETAIKANPKLAKRCKITGLMIRPTAKNNNGLFEALSTSHKSVTGRTRTHLLIDEAKDIEARVAWELIPAISTMSGVECPRGHVQLSKEEAIDAPAECAACGERLVPWYGRLIIASSSGVVDDLGKETDWLHELIEQIKREPSPHVHLFQSDQPLNPAKDQKIVGALEATFGQLDSMGHYVDAGLSNVWRRKGKDVLSKADMKRCEDRHLENLDSCNHRCVGFLDTSTTVEKTALVIFAEDPDSREPWGLIYMARLDYWIPGDLPGGVIDDRAVYSHLDRFLHLYPRLEALAVDTRGQPWAVKMIMRARSERKLWAKKIKQWDKKGDEHSQMGWQSMIKRYLDRTIRVQEHAEIRREFRGVMLKQAGDMQPPKVVDRNRRKMHRDITEAMACCCWMIEELMVKGRHRGMADIQKRSSVSSAVNRLRRGGRQLVRIKPGDY